MLITVRVPDEKAAFFKKVVKEMSFDVTQTSKDQEVAGTNTTLQEARELKSALETLTKVRSGKATLYGEDDFFEQLKSAKGRV